MAVNPHVEQLRGVGEPARQYLWEVMLNGTLPGSTTGGGNDGPTLTYRAMSTTIPDTIVEPYEHQYKSTKVRYAGKDASAKSFDITFFDATDLLVFKNMTTWAEFCINHNKVDYAINMSMVMLGRTDDNDELMTVTLIDAWPEAVQQVTLDYASNDALNVAVTFSYDDKETK